MHCVSRPFVLLCVACFSCAIAGAARAQPKDPAKVDLLADVSAVKPGEPFTVGVRFRMDPGWHVYWLNPGDSGQPPEVTWKLPDGFTAGPLQFPVPKRFEQPGEIVGYGYEDEVLLTAKITPPSSLKPGTSVKIAADVTWLVCEKVCIPGDAKLSIELPVAESASPANRALFDTWFERMPKPASELGAKLSFGRSAISGPLELHVQWPGPAPAKIEWFPPPSSDLNWTDIKVTSEGNRTRVSTKPDLLTGKVPPTTPLESVVAYDAPDGTRKAIVASFVYPGQTVERN
jgi:thiol:disulfide interchange protein DsbD